MKAFFVVVCVIVAAGLACPFVAFDSAEEFKHRLNSLCDFLRDSGEAAEDGPNELGEEREVSATQRAKVCSQVVSATWGADLQAR